MVEITKNEATYLRKVIPNVHITRTTQVVCRGNQICLNSATRQCRSRSCAARVEPYSKNHFELRNLTRC